ncbi:MAG TPA: lytic transglycosylase domain-containing protein, partial [Sphingomonas sp.]|nr:lytic transglycosylase domain-containing protein [Sphingomonas sp.]
MTLTIIRGNGETGGAGPVGGRVQNAIASASASTGVDFHYLYHQAKVESGLNPNARATTSSASGLYQFTEQTWLGTIKNHGGEHGLSWAANAIMRGSNGHYYVADDTTRQEILALRQSPETSAAMAGEYASDNKGILEAKLGRDAGSTDLYMAHFLGPAGATRFLKAKDADPDQPAAAVMPAAARANRWVFYDKAGNPRSLEQVYQRFAARFEQSTPAATMASATGSDTSSDSAADIARMQLAALNGTSEGTTVT